MVPGHKSPDIDLAGQRTIISTYIVESPLEIEFLYGKVRKVRHQIADYSFSFHTPYTHLSHTKIRNSIFACENVL